MATAVEQAQEAIAKSAVLHRSLHEEPLSVVRASGLYLTLSDGRKIIDSTGGAAVSLSNLDEGFHKCVY